MQVRKTQVPGVENASTENVKSDLEAFTLGGQIRRPKKKQNLMNDRRIRSAVGRYSRGGYTATEFLRSVSQCCDNVTRPLNPDIDTGSSTDEYEL